MPLTTTLNEAGAVKIPLTPALSPGRGSLFPCRPGLRIGLEVRAFSELIEEHVPYPDSGGLLWGKMAQTAA